MENEESVYVQIKKRLEQELHEDDLSFGEKSADNIAKFGGSWVFVIAFCFFCMIWILSNTYFFSFDSYPFILLNLFLSCLAAIQAPIMLMSQNRISKIDRKLEKKAYILTIKTEMELQDLNEKLDLLLSYKKS